MRLGFGTLVLAVGALALGWWAQAEYAPFMQLSIRDRAQVAVADSVHGVAITVAGRDITVSGQADGPDDQRRLLAALDGVNGRRVVVDDLEVLPVVTPFVLHAERLGGVVAAQGHAPTAAARARLAGLGAPDLIVAAGAPDAYWSDAAASGLAGLALLDDGRMELSDRALTLTGIARTPVEGDAAQAAVTWGLPDGYSAQVSLSYRDDGTPPAYTLHYSVATGVGLAGKLPVGVQAGDVAAALDLADIDSSATVALTGEPGAVSPVVAALAPWLAEVETLDVAVQPDGVTVDAGFGAGADMELLSATLGRDLASAAQGLTLRLREVAPVEAEGSTRQNPLSGVAEVLNGGYWLPVADFDPAPAICAARVEEVLAARRIGFVTGSAQLDARARGAVNALAGVLGLCLRDGGLRAEIGGHTDATGNDEANLALSRARAQAVLMALVARGVPAAGLSAEGYGAAQPVADNATEDGRAANRRTAVRWIE